MMVDEFSAYAIAVLTIFKLATAIDHSALRLAGLAMCGHVDECPNPHTARLLICPLLTDAAELQGSSALTKKGDTKKGIKCSRTSVCPLKNSSYSQGFYQCPPKQNASPTNYDVRPVGCSKYGDEFDCYLEIGIFRHNNKVICGLTVTACLDACRDETSHLCVTIEYKEEEQLCQLSNKAWDDVPHKFHTYNSVGWNFYQRQCAI